MGNPFHQGKPLTTDVHLATLHYNAWIKEVGWEDVPVEPEVGRRYLHRLAQLIRYVRLGKPALKRSGPEP